MTVRNSRLTFRDAMRWEKTVEDFVSSFIKPDFKVLNAPCGKSIIGTHRLDIDPRNNPTHLGDINSLPFPNCYFDVTVQDPIWKIGYYLRMRPFFECVRVTMLNGLIIYNATWIPESKAVELLESLKVRASAPFANVSVISVFRKIKTEVDGDRPTALTDS